MQDSCQLISTPSSLYNKWCDFQATYRQRVGLDLLPAAGSSLTRAPAACAGLALPVATLTRLLDPGPVPRLRRRRLRRLCTQQRGGDDEYAGCMIRS